MEDLEIKIAALAFSRVQEFTVGRVLSEMLGGREIVAMWEKLASRAVEVAMSDAFQSAIGRAVEEYALDAIEQKTGIRLESLSEEGLARAVGKRAGIELRSLSDAAKIDADLSRAAAKQIERVLGWRFDGAVESVESLMTALERRAAERVEAALPGLVVHNLMDADVVQGDALAYAAGRISAKTGVSFANMADADEVKRDVVRFSREECRRRIGVSGGVGGGLKMTKKAIANRQAQRKFYAAHGDRHETR